MSLEDIDISEGSEQGTSGAEKSREQSEKQRESYKKAQAQIQKTQKDEKKAKGDNDALFQILQRFIQNPYYSDLIPVVTKLLSLGVPARFIVFFIAIVYPEASLFMLESLEKKEEIHSLLDIHRAHELEDFHESNLHPSIRLWMSKWVQYGKMYTISEKTSIILLNKVYIMFSGESFREISGLISEILTFFFLSRNIRISEKKARAYAEFILSDIRELLSGFLSSDSADKDLLKQVNISESDLFGV